MANRFQILKISKQMSRYTKKPVFAVFFKADDGGSYKTWLDPSNGNFRRWEGVMKVNNVLTGLRVKDGRLIDADSYPKLVEVEDVPAPPPAVEPPAKPQQETLL